MPFLFAAIGSALLGAGSSIFGASQEAGASKEAAQLQYQEFEQTQKLLSPYVNAGAGTGIAGLESALGTIGQGFNPNTFTSTPQYKFELQQGEQAIEDTATATGGVGSGNTVKALMGYGQGLASTSYQQYFNDWLAQNQALVQGYGGLANLGESAAAGTGAAGQQYATAAGNDLMGGASALAAGASGVTNSLNNGLQNYLLYNALNNTGGGGGGGGGDYSAFMPG